MLILGLLYPNLASLLEPPPPSPFALGRESLREEKFYRAELLFREALSISAPDDGANLQGQVLGYLGLLSLLRGDNDLAYWQLQAAVQADPSETPFLAYLGQTLENLDLREAALQTWSEALNRPGPSFLALGLRAESHYRLGEMGEADRDFTALLENDLPGEWQRWACLRLAILSAVEGSKQAQAYIEQAQTPFPPQQNTWYPSPELLFGMPAGEGERRIEELAGLLEATPGASREENILAIGQMLLGQADTSGAAFLLEQIAHLAENDMRVLAYLGYARFSVGQEKEGLRNLHTSLVWAADDPLPHLLVARAYLERGWYRAAVNELLRAVATSPGDPVILADLAEAYRQEGDYEQAAHWFKEAVSYRTGTDEEPVYRLMWARFHQESGWDICGDGLVAAESLARLTPEWPVALRIQGAILARCGFAAEAVAVLDQATKLDPNSAEGFDSLGLAYLALGSEAAARGAFRRAANQEPASRWSRHARSWLEEH
jgi:tetratricopeptide (TPR) repeat protein